MCVTWRVETERERQGERGEEASSGGARFSTTGREQGREWGAGERRGVKEGRMAVISATGTRKRILDGYLPCSTFVGAPSLLSLSLFLSLFLLLSPSFCLQRPGTTLVSLSFSLALFRGASTMHSRCTTRPGGVWLHSAARYVYTHT